MNNGNAKTDSFLLATATLMMGSVAELYDLNPAEHSVGLIKNVNHEANKETTDLTQGILNDIVYSVTTGAPIRITGEMYEFTEKNMAYGLSLDGATFAPIIGGKFTTTAAAAANTNPLMTDLTVDTPTTPQTLVAGDTVMIKTPSDNVILATVNAAVSTNKLTIRQAIATPSTAIPVGSTVSKVNVLNLGDNGRPQYYSAKLIGELPNGDIITIMYPKVKVVSGLSLAFSTSDFANMGMELEPMALLMSDPHYADFKSRKGMMAKGKV